MQSELLRDFGLAVAVAQHRCGDGAVALVFVGRGFERPGERRTAEKSLPLGDILELLPPARPAE